MGERVPIIQYITLQNVGQSYAFQDYHGIYFVKKFVILVWEYKSLFK